MKVQQEYTLHAEETRQWETLTVLYNGLVIHRYKHDVLLATGPLPGVGTDHVMFLIHAPRQFVDYVKRS
jgi:hypothetical protein